MPWRPIRANPRLQKHVTVLYGLTVPESLSLENKEDDVAEFEDRFKRATAKAGIIGKIIGEEVKMEVKQGEEGGDGAVRQGAGDVGIEDVDILKVRH